MAPIRKKCCICQTNEDVTDSFHYYRLPKNEQQKQQWLEWIFAQNGSNCNISKSLFVCSNHFDDSVKGFKKLKAGAVPSLNGTDSTSPTQPSQYTAAVQERPEYNPEYVAAVQEMPEYNPEYVAAVQEMPEYNPEYVEAVQEMPEYYPEYVVAAQEMPEYNPEYVAAVQEMPEYNPEYVAAMEEMPNYATVVEIPAYTAVVEIDMQMVSSAADKENQQLLTVAPCTPRKKRMTRKCVAPGCHSSGTNKFFTFPSIFVQNQIDSYNAERCKKWLTNCGNIALVLTETRKLHSKYFLCSEHFTDNQFFSSDRKILLPNAVPTLFCCDPLTEIQMASYPVLNLGNILMDPTYGTDPDNTNFMDKYQQDFETHMHSVKWITCKNCNEKFFKPANSNIKCMHGLKNCTLYSKDNDMDPFTVPQELLDLSYVEEQLIAQIHPLISVLKLSGHHQFGYRGNVINFPQDVNSIAKTLPHTIENLSSLVTIRTRDAVNPKDFHVRSGKIRVALQKLKEINPYYHDIEISEENLWELPEDGNIFERVTRVINIDSNENDNEEELNLEDGDDFESNFITETCVPSMSKPKSSDRAETVLQWPTIGKDAINEFKTPGYVVMAFPCLFPYGKADLRSPRDKQITPNQYFKHLLRYHDERFAKHPRFRYFALNSLMRWSALRNGGVCVKKNTPFKDMNITQLREELQTNPNLLKKILFYNSNLRGTRSYWHTRGQELLAMIEQIGLPTLFNTLSAADLHWPDLFRNIAPDEDINTITEARRRTLIAENPLKVDAFFMERGEQFINKVLREKYNVQDLWFRIEYQHRGSPHIHGVLWLEGAPKFDNLSKESPERLDEIARYFDQFVSTTHPDTECPKGPTHPCRKKLSDILDVQKDLAELLNRVQRHTQHREGYCLRKNKKTGKKECRFKFPFDLVEKTEIKVTEDNDVELITARNDRYLNKYNSYIIQTWRANIDVSPVLSRRALINYLAKYVTKSETKSKEMTAILQELINKTAEDKPVKSIIQSLYIQSCCERDISAQETCHLLMGLPLHSAGRRQFVTLNFKVLDAEGWVEVPDDEAICQKSYIEKYMERPETYNGKSLWYMAKNFKLPRGKRHPHGKEAVIQVYPRLSKNTLEINPEMFFRQKVLLFVPWRFEDEILEKYGSWEEAYNKYENLITSSFQPECSLDGLEPSNPEYEDIDPEDSQITDQWMCISRMGPSQEAEQVELGRRDLDVNYDWHESTHKYNQQGGVDTIKNFVFDERKKATPTSHIPTMPSVEFTKEQQTVLNLLKLQIESLKNDTVQTHLVCHNLL